ncbi:MAG: adenylate/guanylate cyclase domain-containing protein, partial [Chloroflexi bacterium]|nr:adenylate/guanylate cyclase domain-containing protein [Chloroflexota bacterium]
DNLAEQHTLIVYDARGMGLSQREVVDYTLQAASDDLRAVADLYELRQFAMLGFRGTAKTAVHFAATHPERVSRMVLRDPVLARPDQVLRPRERTLQSMIETDFEFYIDAMSLSLAGWETGRSLAEGARHATTREAFLAAQAISRGEDGWDYVRGVTCPTLVVHARSSAASFPIDVARRAASGMARASFTVMDGAAPYDAHDAAEFAALALHFLGDGQPEGPVGARIPSGMAIILFADIADSTALTERLGDAAFRERARALDTALRRAVRDNGGAAIDGKLLGDGILATFPAASQAIGAALACGAAGAAQGLPLHLGLHAGDVIRESDPGGQSNVYGGAVNIAARISALSAPGEVLVSRTVADLARTSAGVAFEDRGEHALKGIAEPQRVYAVVSG